jgi:spore coat polysaccharide biosynthesis protein SpsF
MQSIALLQVRTDSSRLPGKCFLEIDSKSLIDRCLENLINLNEVYEEIAVLTTDRAIDDLIVDKCIVKGVKVFRGAVDDVLGRFAESLSELDVGEVEWVSRLTGDNPFVLDSLHSQIMQGIRARSEGVNKPTFFTSRNFGIAKGLEIEIFNLAALRVANSNAKTEYEREHVTPFMYHSESIETIEILVDNPRRYAKQNGFTIDTLADWQSANYIAKDFRNLSDKLSKELTWKFR